jgi:hypothetical protein
MHTRHAYKKPSPFLTSRQPGLIYIQMTGILLLLSLVISMSNMIHFVDGFNGLTKMHAVDMNHSSSSVVFRRRLSLSGSRNLARNQNLLQNVAYEKQFNRSQVVVFDLARTGSEDSLPGIQQLNSESLQVLIQSVQNASIGRMFEATLSCFRRFLTSCKYPGRMSGIWMKRVVKEEEVEIGSKTICREVLHS